LFGQTPVEIYGSSETGGIAWRQRSVGSDSGEHEAWTAMPQIALRISDNAHLEVCSPHLFDQSWYVTSDWVALISQSRFHLKGRSDRIVKIEEKRISLERIEQTLLASSLVDQVKTMVNHDPHNQFHRSYVAAVVILTEEGRNFLLLQGRLALNNFLKNTLAGVVESLAVPRKWRYVDQFPMDQQGKVTQALLITLFKE
jgi:acyl-coenzyme A synthetase/AMP-(fatty) acid ligase